MNFTDHLTTLDPERISKNINANDPLLFSFVLCVCKCVLSFPIMMGNGFIYWPLLAAMLKSHRVTLVLGSSHAPISQRD